MTFLGLHVALATRNPDALRSESFVLRRTALEYLEGDDEHGLRREVSIDQDDELEIVAAPEGRRIRIEAPPFTPEERAEAEADEDDQPESPNAKGRKASQ